MNVNWRVVLQDICKVRCDAIVNAANKIMLGGAGVDGCIHFEAGPELVRYIEKNVPTIGVSEADDEVPIRCDVGMAVTTPSFGLQHVCRSIIHTVGPIWTGGRSDEARMLAKCYWSCLDEAKAMGFKSIAFPCISTGCYRFPNAMAADIAVRSVASWFRRNQDSDIEVIFVTYTVKDHELYENFIPYYNMKIRKRGEKAAAKKI